MRSQSLNDWAEAEACKPAKVQNHEYIIVAAAVAAAFERWFIYIFSLLRRDLYDSPPPLRTIMFRAREAINYGNREIIIIVNNNLLCTRVARKG